MQGVQFQDLGFRFQAGNYPTFHPVWKAVLSAAMVAWEKSQDSSDGSPGRSLGEIVMEVRDATSGKFRENIKQGECDSPQRQLPKSIKCFCPVGASFVVGINAEGGAND